jgi:sec-independent protein translocase protein TatA
MGELLAPSHLLIVLLVAFVFFGGKKLPELGAGLGKGIRSFKDSLKEVTADHDKIDTPAAKSETAEKRETVEK